MDPWKDDVQPPSGCAAAFVVLAAVFLVGLMLGIWIGFGAHA